jgi:hypothetical protein
MTERKHFIVKHGLDAFTALPNFVWQTGIDPKHVPHRYNQIKLGNRWVGFAYTTSDNQERSLSLVTGFYECTDEAIHRAIPASGCEVSDGERKAWMIEGKAFGRQPRQPVGVLPINDLLGRQVWNNQGIIPISQDDFERIKEYALGHELNADRIPLLRREPRCEQELLAIVVSAHKKLGIKKIVRIQTAFPDMRAEIEEKSGEVHLELEVYSSGFFAHGHDKQVHNRRYKKDGRPVAILCWIDNDKSVRKHVHRVYELQSLIREGQTIRW